MVDASRTDYMLDPPDDPVECPVCDAWMDELRHRRVRGIAALKCPKCGYTIGPPEYDGPMLGER